MQPNFVKVRRVGFDDKAGGYILGEGNFWLNLMHVEGTGFSREKTIKGEPLAEVIMSGRMVLFSATDLAKEFPGIEEEPVKKPVLDLV